MPSFVDLNRLGSSPSPASFDPGIQPFNGPMMHGRGPGVEIYETFTPFQPGPPSVIDQRWPAPHEMMRPTPTFNERWPAPHEQFRNMDHPLFEGPGETDQDFFRQQYASLSGPRDLAPGGMRDLGVDPLTSPFASSGIQDLNRYDRLGGMTGNHGGTDPRFFGGGINMPDWNQPQLTPQDHVNTRFPTQWQQETFMPSMSPMDYRWNLPQVQPQSRIDQTFSDLGMGGPGFDDWTRMAGGGDFPDRSNANPLAMGGIGGGANVPYDDPRGDFIGDGGGGDGGGRAPSSSGPQIALMMPFPSVFDRPTQQMTSDPRSFNLHTSGNTPDWARVASGPTPLNTPIYNTPPLTNYSPPPAPTSNWVNTGNSFLYPGSVF